MKWMKYSLKTTTEAVDLISDMLNEMGFEGIEIEDHVPLSEADKQKMFVDILPETAPDDGTATVNFYLQGIRTGQNIKVYQLVNGQWVELTVTEIRDDHIVVDMTSLGTLAFIEVPAV